MEKVYGSPKRQDGLYKTGRMKYELIFGFGKDKPEDESGWNWRQRFDHLPTLSEIKDAVTGQLTAVAEDRRQTGFSWNGVPLRYDEEMERHINSLSVKLPRLETEIFPLRLKLGEYPDGTPAFYEFENIEEFDRFTDALLLFVQQCYAKMIEDVSAVDWSKFEVVL